MNTISAIAQVIIAVSIVAVWVFRFDNIVLEFQNFRLSNLTRNLVGATKISLSTLLVAGIWYSNLIFFPAVIMAILMICAQWAHFRIKNPFIKFVPSFALLILCIFVASIHA